MIPTWVDPHWFESYWYGETPRRKFRQRLQNVTRRVGALLAPVVSKATNVSFRHENGRPSTVIDLSRARLARAAIRRSARGAP